MSVISRSLASQSRLVSQALSDCQLHGGPDVAATSCTARADAVRPGDVFVACDHTADSHSAAQSAVARGAAAIVAERYLPIFGVPQYIVEDAPQAYSQLCHAILDHPTHHINAIGIAGSHGKTSIAMVLDSILNIAGKSVATATNQFTRVEAQRTAFMLPTTAPAIADFADEALASGCRYATIELSEATLASKAASAAQFDIVCLANLHTDHSCEDRSPKDHRQTMASALDLLSPQGMAILNADDPDSMRILSQYDGPALTYGVHRPADIAAELIEQNASEQTFLLTIGDESAAVRTKVIGQAHIQNCLAAAAIAKVYGVSLRDIVRGIDRVTVVPGVMHRFDAGLGIPVFLDRGHSAIAKGAALSAARGVATQQVIAVVSQECTVTEALADRTIATQGLADEQVVTDAVARVLAALEVGSNNQLKTITEKLTGVALAILAAKPGDVVVVSGLDGISSNARRVSVSVNESAMIQNLMYELAAHQKKAA